MTTPLNWRPWNTAGYESQSMRNAWDLACAWLADFGIHLTGDGGEPPEMMAQPEHDLYAFHLDQGAEPTRIVVLVTVDYDPPARAVRVEVRRG